MKIVAVVFLWILLLCVPVCAHEVTVGVASLGNEYSRENYIVSESNGIISGIVSRGLTTGVDVQGGYTELTQDSAGNKFYVFFTRGTRESIVSRAGYLMDNTFEKFYSPSFGFELKSKKHIMMSAIYDTFDIVGDERLRAGNYNLLIRYERLVSGRPQISIAKSN